MSEVSSLSSPTNIPRNYPEKNSTNLNSEKNDFQKILDTKQEPTKATNSQTIRDFPLLDQETSTESLSNTESIGTNLAIKKQLKEYAVSFERHIISSMWQFAYASTKGESEGLADTLYSGQFINQMVGQAYGEDGGTLAESVYEKLVQDYAQYIEEVNNENEFDKEF